MGQYADDNKNKKPGIPKFDILKKGRIEASVFRMDTGFLVINQEAGTKHSVTDEESIREMLKLISEDVAIKLADMLNELDPQDYVDLTIVLEGQKAEIETTAEVLPEPTSLDLGQLAAVINDLLQGYGDPTGLRGRSLHVTPGFLANYMSSPRMVQITKKQRIADDQGKGNSSHSNKPFYHSSGKGQNKPPQDTNKGGNKGGDNDEAKPNEVK